MSITILIIVLTCITSIAGINNPNIKQQLIFSPYIVHQRKEWFRFLSSGFIHADWLHLIVNMYVLYRFGTITEMQFMDERVFAKLGATFYILLYIFAIALSELYSYFRNVNNPSYQSLGASGAVAAIIFASILLAPQSGIGLIFLPEGKKIPGFIFGILYLLYSMYMARNANDNVGHNAHFYGAVFGFLFPIVLKPELFMEFMQQISYGR